MAGKLLAVEGICGPSYIPPLEATALGDDIAGTWRDAIGHRVLSALPTKTEISQRCVLLHGIHERISSIVPNFIVRL